MDESQLTQIRRFNRVVTQRTGALEADYLRRGRPLAEARLIFEIGADGVDVRTLRLRLGLDSGYLSRLMRSLKAQGLIAVANGGGDGRRRRASLTRKGRAERAAYDRLSDRLAASMLETLDEAARGRLVTAMGEVERLIRAASVEVAAEAPESADARRCLDAYFNELAARFEGGFDRAKDDSARANDMTPPSGLFVVARLDGEPVGCGGLKRSDKTTGEIKRVWTAPSARGVGVARRVLRALEAAGRDMGIKTLRLGTNRALTEAHALYRKEGFRAIARFNDNPYEHRWFEKRL
ncbi:MAG TPA: helix-turn-helix domain-containing GNAT family N-acetyltransferase [Roseiarcus sp.]|jgi:DNA-binding MarR family transcriptional regulator/GNAT superfamily N-acetyltransferase